MWSRDEPWRTASCEHCAYRVADECRRAPPQWVAGKLAEYPRVRMDMASGKTYFVRACTSFEREQGA